MNEIFGEHGDIRSACTKALAAISLGGLDKPSYVIEKNGAQGRN